MSASRLHRHSTIPRRPDGARLLRMAWTDLLFLHWPFEPAVVRDLLPEGLELDTRDGQAWVGVVPFRMTGARPILAPSVPGLSSFLELNVRTYVRCNDEAGVYFFSLDASNPIAVWFARTFFHLPYFRARIEMRKRHETIRFTSRRTHQGASPGEFECVWAPKGPLPRAKKGELVHFLTERYRLFTEHRGQIYSCAVWHEPWSLREVRMGTLRSNVLESAGLPPPTGEPIAHHADLLAVDAWPLRVAGCAESEAPLLDPALSRPPPA